MKNFGIACPDFFREEIRNDYLVPAAMKRAWACQLDLLKELLRVCDKYNLKCWADYGTLLGAVRHKGYIPWDDDIDMVMLREDYDKFVEIADKELKHPYFLQTIYSDKHYNHRHAQLRNSDTAAIPEGDFRRKYNQGIFVDIFILDSYPKAIKYSYRMVRKVKLYRVLLKLAIRLMNLLPDGLYQKWRLDSKVFLKYENVLRKNRLEDTEFVAAISFNFRQKIRDKAWYAETLWVDFEHMKMPVPIGYDRILTLDFGPDYMTPVQAPALHGGLIFDTEKSYKLLRKELRHGKMK